jgi:hypothetical protein
MTTKSDGKKSSSVCGAEPGGRPSRCRLEHLPSRLELLYLFFELVADLLGGALDRRLRGHVLRRREEREVVELAVDLAGQRVEMRDLLDLVAEERDPVRRFHVRRLHLDYVALDAELASAEQGVVTDVLDVDQLPQHEVAVVLLALVQQHDPLLVLLGRAEAVDGRDRRDDDHVAAREQRGRRGVAKAVDVVVSRRVFLDVEIGLRHVRLGLVVVVVGDEVLDRVVGEELAQLVAELRGERLVVRDQERGPLHLLDDPRHRRRLPRSGGAEEGLEAVARLDSLGELGDRLRLVGHRRVRLRGFELRHRAKRLPGDHVHTDALPSQCVDRPRRPSRHGLPGRRRQVGALGQRR